MANSYKVVLLAHVSAFFSTHKFQTYCLRTVSKKKLVHLLLRNNLEQKIIYKKTKKSLESILKL